MSKNKVIKPVSFNKTKQNDSKLLDHVKDKNFSGYVKDLIEADIVKQEATMKIVHKSTGGGIKIVVGR